MRWIGARIHLTWTAFRKGLSIRASMAPTAKGSATLCSRRIHLLKEREGGRVLEARKGYPHDPCRSSTSSKETFKKVQHMLQKDHLFVEVSPRTGFSRSDVLERHLSLHHLSPPISSAAMIISEKNCKEISKYLFQGPTTLCSRRIHLLKEREGGRALEARKGYPHNPCRSSTSSKLVEQSGLLEVPGFFCRYKLLNFPNTLLPQVVKPSPSAHVATNKASILVLHLQ
ncbi:hypothetical protein SOVF_026480 isoform A, partial [Spinacia oleracea]